MSEPKTVAERLDAADDGQQFAGVLHSLFASLEQAIDDEDDDRGL
jgi:hypothetical protein